MFLNRIFVSHILRLAFIFRHLNLYWYYFKLFNLNFRLIIIICLFLISLFAFTRYLWFIGISF